MRKIHTNEDGSILIQSGPLEGLVVLYGGVSFEELDDNLKIKFDYELLNDYNHGLDKAQLKRELGDILVYLIDVGLMTNNVWFKGGDED